MTVAFDFDGNAVEMSLSMGGLSYSFDGTYELTDDTITFSFDDPDGENSIFQSMLEGLKQSVDFERTDNGIKIDGTEYTKE